MSLGNPVFTVFQSKNSRHVFFVRYKDGTIDVFSARDFKEAFPDIDPEASGEFNSAAKAIQYADEELGIDDRNVDVFGGDDDDEIEEEEEQEEEEDDEDRVPISRPRRYGMVEEGYEDEEEDD